MKSIYTPEYRALLAWLRQCRQTQGLSQRDVGAKLRLPHSWIGKIETGERRLDMTEFVRLCRALHADPHEGLDVVERFSREVAKSAKGRREETTDRRG